MSEVSNRELLQAIKDLSKEVQGNNQKLVELEEKIINVETEIKELKSEVTSDIRKLDQKFTLVLKDLHEARTDIHVLQQEEI